MALEYQRRTRMTRISRRDVLVGTALVLVGDAATKAGVIHGGLPWHPNAGSPPEAVPEGPWLYFTAEEGAAVEALVDRIIPPDPNTPGGKGAGCAVYIDRQLVGPYGSSADLYMKPPFLKGIPQQGSQSPDPPARVYRKALAALDKYCRAEGGQPFAMLPVERQDQLLEALEAGKVQLEEADGKLFFETLLKNTQEGFSQTRSTGATRICAGGK